MEIKSLQILILKINALINSMKNVNKKKSTYLFGTV